MSSTGGYVWGAQEKKDGEKVVPTTFQRSAASAQLGIPLSLPRLRSAERDILALCLHSPPPPPPNWGIWGCTRMAQMGVGTQGRKPVGAPPSSSGKHHERMTFILSWSQTAALSAVTQR